MTKDNLPEILPPKSDVVFKMLLGDENDTSFLINFLDVVLKKEIKSVVILNPALKPSFVDGKKSVLDIKAQLDSGEYIDIEIQLKRNAEMRSRISFYNDKMITDQLGEGKNYLEIKPAISIIIADDVIIHESQKCHNVFLMLEKDEHFPFNGLKEIHILELSRVSNENDSKVFDWLSFIKAKKKEEFMAIAERNPVMGQLFGKLRVISADEQARMEYEDNLKAERDNRMWQREAREEGLREGLQQGMQQGMQEGMLQIARNLKAEGLDLHFIARTTGLTFDEVLNA